MGLYYKISDKELLSVRNAIFLEDGIPCLNKNGFIKSPFSTAWGGKNNLGDYTYELCRISNGSILEFIVTHISKGDYWIKIYLNVFKLYPEVIECKQLINTDGLHFHLPPNSLTKMRLRIDDFKGIPLFRRTEHRLKKFNTQNGFEKSVEKLRILIRKDMSNIDSFVKRWHEMHKPLVTDWNGNPLS